MNTSDTRTADQPWKGLDFYTEGDTDLFFGREAEELEMLRFVRREALTVLFGRSGTGKTSLLYAGLFPRLRRDNYLPIPIRRLQFDSELSLAQQTKELIEEALTGSGIEVERSTPLTGDETLWEYLHRSEFWNERNQLVSPVLVFDQFEEVFTLGHHLPGTEEFLVELADLVENYVPVRFLEQMESEKTRLDFPYEKQRYKIVVALRDDFVHRLDGLRSTMPSIMRNRYRLKRLSHDHAMEAVLGPGKAIVDEGVARAIVDWVAAADEEKAGPRAPRQPTSELEIEPAILSLVCRELNRRREAAGHNSIHIEDLHESQTDILTDFYEDSFKNLDPRARVFVEDRLITGSGFRTAVPLEDAGEIEDAIEALMQRRLVRSEERLGIPHVELSHDRLTDLVLASRRDREDRRHREEAARKERELQEEEDRERAALHQAREARSSRQLNRVLAGAVAVLFILGAGILYQKGQVSFAADEAKAWELALQAADNLEDDPELSIILGLHSAALTRGHEVGVLPVTLEVLNRALTNSREEARFEVGPGRVSRIVFRADGQILATANADGIMRAWDTESGNERSVPNGKEGSIVALSGDGRRFAEATGSTVLVRDLDTGLEVFAVRGMQGKVPSLALADGGTRLAAAIFDENGPTNIGVWDVEGNMILEEQIPHNQLDEHPNSLVFSNDGRRLAVSYYDLEESVYRISVWDVDGENILGNFEIDDPVTHIVLNFNGSRLAAAVDTTFNTGRERARAGKLWAVDSGEPLLVDLQEFSEGKPLAFGPNDHLAIARPGGSFAVWDLDKESKREFTFAGHSGSVLGITFDPNGEKVATVGSDGTARIWNLHHDSRLSVTGDDLLPIVEVAFSPDGNNLATVDQSGAVRVVPQSSSQPSANNIWSVAYSPYGDLAAAGVDLAVFAGILKTWPGGDTIGEPTEFHPASPVFSVAYSPDGKLLATSSFDNQLRIWDSGDPEQEPASTGTYSLCQGLAFDPGGARLAASCWNKTVAVWDLADLGPESAINNGSAQPPKPLVLRQDALVNDIVFSDNGKRLATAGNDGTVTMWDAQTGATLFDLTGHESGVSGVAFRPRESREAPLWLATSSLDGTVRIWNVAEIAEDGKELKSGEEVMMFDGDLNTVNDLAFTVDGKQLAAAGEGGTKNYVFDVDELIGLAWEAITRQPKTLTDAECRKYLPSRDCEPPDVQPDSPDN